MERRVELFAAIRFDWQRYRMPVRALARKYDVHRRTVRQAIASPVPPDRKVPERAAPVREAVAGWIDEMLREDLAAPRKQRHTARRVFERLADEHDARVSYSYVAKYVGRRRAEITAEDRDGAEGLAGFVPQAREPGAEAEVDFGDVTVELAGQLSRCFLFAYRLSYSGKGVHRVYASQAQEAFLEGHVTAFEVTGGVPFRQIRYDNLSAAVAKVLTGRNRTETQRWLSFRAFYGFEAFYCQPGPEGAHEKGGVEGEIGRFRRRWFVPVPRAGSLAELNARLAEADAAEDGRHIAGRAATVGEDFAAERGLLLPLPPEPFATAAVLWPRVDRYARISVGKCRYSVPARLIGSRVRVMLSANELRVLDGSKLAAVHPRLIAAGDEHLELDHYLEILVRKPGALPGSAALAQARAAGVFTSAHEAFWAAARARHGDAAGTRALIEVLLLHRRMPAGQVIAGMTAALGAGSCSPERGRGRGPQAPRRAPRASRRAVLAGGAAAALARGGHHLAGPAGPAPAGPASGTVGGCLRPAAHRTGRRRVMARAARDELTDTAADAAIDQACRILRLPTIRDRHGEVAAAASRQQASYKGFLVELLSIECDDRETRRKARLVREAAFPRPKRIEDFDYTANPNVPAALIHTLAGSAWVAAGQPCCLIGDSGTGKSHLLIGLGTAAAENGYRVRYVTAAALVNELVEAADDKTLSRTIARYGRVDLLCLDELGYLELDRRGAELLFQVFTEREERASIAIASNAAFSEWTSTFTDPRLCAAIVDRLTFDAHIITTGTDSYRLRTAQARHQAPRA